MRALAVALLVLCASLTRAAYAQDADTRSTYRAVVDRVEYEPGTLTGMRLRIYLSALTLGGQLLPLSESKEIKTYLGSSELKEPFAIGNFQATHGDTAIVVLVQATLDFQDVLPSIADSLDRDLLATLPDSSQVVVLPYGETAATGKFATVKMIRGKLQLATDNSVGDPAMLDTLDRALMLLKRAKTEPEGASLRKIVLVIGDGRDNAGDRDRVTRTGLRAAKEGVRIHTFAFSSADVRRPMLALGELSKQSLGTFRWVRSAAPDSWKAATEQLRDEINKQVVLTYFFTPSEDIAGKKLKVVTVGRTETTSNEAKVPSPACGATECTSGYCANNKCMKVSGDEGRGVLGWLLLIGGIGVGAVVVLGVIGFFITKAQQRRPPPMYPPGMYPGMQQMPPGMQMPPGVQMPPGMQMPPGVQMPQAPAKKEKKKKGAAALPPGFLPNGRPIPALMIMSGPLAGQRHMIHNGYLIGKQPGCNLILPDGAASSQHAQIGMDTDGNCKLYDRGSTNGTFINGNRVTEMALLHGASITIGSTEMRFLAE